MSDFVTDVQFGCPGVDDFSNGDRRSCQKIAVMSTATGFFTKAGEQPYNLVAFRSVVIDIVVITVSTCRRKHHSLVIGYQQKVLQQPLPGQNGQVFNFGVLSKISQIENAGQRIRNINSRKELVKTVFDFQIQEMNLIMHRLKAIMKNGT
jgi:hypothetical protein